MKTRNIQISMILLLAMLFSCSTNDENDNSNQNNSTSVLVKRITYSDTPDIIILTYHGNKLEKMASENNNEYRIYTYDGDLIKKSEVFKGNISTEYTEYVFTNNKLTQAKMYSEKVLAAKFDYGYNTDGTTEIIETTYSTNGASYVHKNKYYYDDVGNIIKEEDLSYSPPTTTINIYDNKPNPFKNITGWNKFFLYSANNKIKATTKISGLSEPRVESISYQYNSQGYPISCSSSSDGKTPSITNYYY